MTALRRRPTIGIRMYHEVIRGKNGDKEEKKTGEDNFRKEIENGRHFEWTQSGLLPRRFHEVGITTWQGV